MHCCGLVATATFGCVPASNISCPDSCGRPTAYAVTVVSRQLQRFRSSALDRRMDVMALEPFLPGKLSRLADPPEDVPPDSPGRPLACLRTNASRNAARRTAWGGSDSGSCDLDSCACPASQMLFPSALACGRRSLRGVGLWGEDPAEMSHNLGGLAAHRAEHPGASMNFARHSLCARCLVMLRASRCSSTELSNLFRRCGVRG